VAWAVGLDETDPLLRGALRLAAGLGSAALLLALLALGGLFAIGPYLLAALTVPSLLWFVRRRPVGLPRLPLAAAPLAVAALAALAPVTDPDSLAYPLPIARRLAEDGAWRFWPEMWRGVFPLSQEMLTAVVLRLGGDRPAALTALELALGAALLYALARRLAGDEAAPAALLLGFGCPVAAYLAISAKEDLLLCAMALAAAHALLSGRAAAAGLFAGFAAGAKYPGLGVVAGVVLYLALTRRWRGAAAAAGTALLGGGVWYAVNLARFGNPLPPYLAPPLPSFLTPLATAGALETFRWGEGRAVVDALLAPVRMLIHPDRFGTAGGLFHPLAWLGLVEMARDRRRHAPLATLFVMLYAVWFCTNQVARLLLPAALLLSVPAAACLARPRVPRWLRAAVLVASAACPVLIGGLHLVRYLREPATFLERQTQGYADLAWMNEHLDASRGRVATMFKACDPLRIPWINLDPSYQAEIAPEEMRDPDRFLAALRRARVTHLFVPRGRLPALEARLTAVRENPASRLGGVHLLREAPTVATAVYRLP